MRAGGTARLAAPGRRRSRRCPTRRAGTHALAALSGAFGDALEREGSPLAVRMGSARTGARCPWTARPWRGAFPDATPRVALFTHGLCESEAGWHLAAERHYGDPDSWHGSRLRARPRLHARHGAREHRPAHLRQRPPPGPAAGPAGRLLAGAGRGDPAGGPLDGRADQPQRLPLRHGGRRTPWVERVRNVVTLGAPHLGAPLEQAAARAGRGPELDAGVAAAGPGAGPAQRGHQGPALRRAGGRGLAGPGPRRRGARTRAATSRCWRAPRTT